MKTPVPDDTVGKQLHLLIQQPIAFLHVVKQRGQVSAEDSIDAEFVRSLDQELPSGIDLKAGRFANVDVSVDHHSVTPSKLGLGDCVNNKVILSVTNYLDRAARSLGFRDPEDDRSLSAIALVASRNASETSVTCAWFSRTFSDADRGYRMFFLIQDWSRDTIAAKHALLIINRVTLCAGSPQDLLLML